MDSRLKLYFVNMKYIRNLHKVDDRVFSVSPQTGKQNRPFLGTIVMVNGMKYCIPLSSHSDSKKDKIDSIRENITMRKVKDEKGKVLAILNLNNMIPVRDEYIEEIDLRVDPKEKPEKRRWKIMCGKELDWCQKNAKEIEHLANELHEMYCSGQEFKKRKICLDFPALEKECNKAKSLEKQ